MNRIQQLREKRGWSQARLGKELHCTDVTISRYETGKNDLSTDTICRLCDIFSCTADYLLRRSDVPAQPRPEDLRVVSAEEAELLRRYAALNDTGRDEWMKYTDYLLSRPEYRRSG